MQQASRHGVAREGLAAPKSETRRSSKDMAWQEKNSQGQVTAGFAAGVKAWQEKNSQGQVTAGFAAGVKAWRGKRRLSGAEIRDAAFGAGCASVKIEDAAVK